jgi:hypothetical protein
MSLSRELIRELINDKVVTAVYGGGFKPPTAGHLLIIQKALEAHPEIDKFIIYVGGGVRDEIGQDESLLIWDKFKKLLPSKVDFVPSKAPIGDILRYGKNNPDEIVYFVIGSREGNDDDLRDIAARTTGVEDKYPNIKVKTFQTPGGGMSGTNARKALNVSAEEFYKYLPTELSIDDKAEIYNILRPTDKLNEDIAFERKRELVKKIIQLARKAGDVASLDRLADMIAAQIRVDAGQKPVAGSFKVIGGKPFTENATYSKDIDIIEKCAALTNYMRDLGMNIDPVPSVEFVNGDTENAKDFFGKTAYYDPNEQKIVLYTEGRHPKDIVRSYAHEMIHHMQNLDGRLGDITTTNTQEDDHLNDLEAEANLKGTMSFRNWTDSLQEKKVKDPFGLNAYAQELARGLEEETINEGRYDSISRQLASISLNAWKSDFKDGASYGYFMGEITPEEYPTDLTFVFKALGKFVDGEYKHNGYSKADGEVGVKYEIPKDAIPQIWEEVYMDLISTIRHEIEHQTQTGKNVKPGKEMESDQELRQMIRKGGSDIVKYVTLPREIESNVHGLYLKAKKWRRPYDEVADEYITNFLKITNPADVNYVKSKWQEVAKKRNLPDLLNEGVYDSLVTRLSKDVINTWKSQFEENPKRLFALLDKNYEEEDAKGRPMEFDLLAKLDFKKTKDRQYKVDGGANEGSDEDEGFVALNFTVDPRELPRMWSTIAMDIRDVLRHELEHLTQGGYNVRAGKEMEDDSFIRDLIQKYKTLAPKNYFMLDKEVDAMLQGMYYKAKKSRTPFGDVLNDYLDKVGLEPEEKEEIKNRWRGRVKALSLPVFESKYKLKTVLKEEETEQKYQIYCDMDGVLTDFDEQFKKLSDGVPPGQYEEKNGKDVFWNLIHNAGVGFWVGMPWMPNGKTLWGYISKYNPTILSAPSRENESRLGKRLWVRNNLSPKPKLILASAENKQNYAGADRILIDDRPSNVEQWRSKGGIGILFVSTEQTINELKELGL